MISQFQDDEAPAFEKYEKSLSLEFLDDSDHEMDTPPTKRDSSASSEELGSAKSSSAQKQAQTFVMVNQAELDELRAAKRLLEA